MKKRAIIFTVTAMLLLALTACGNQNDSVKCIKAVEAALEKTALSDVDTTVNFDEDLYSENFEKLYNFSIDQVDDGVIAYASSGGSADEISVVHVKDSKDVSSVRKYMEARLEKRLQDFQNYKPEEVSKIENGKVVVQQQYVMFVISDKADDLISTMREVLS